MSISPDNISGSPISQGVVRMESVVEEPKWETMFDDDLDIKIAREQWQTILAEVQQQDSLSAVVGHQIKRLVLFYVLYEVACRHVFTEGAVKKARRSKVPQYNPWFTIMKDATAMASAAEKELMVTPKRMQQNGQKAKTAKLRKPRAADAYLGRPHRHKGQLSS